MKIAVLAGGISTERDVSLVSGREVYKALKRKGHNVILIDAYMGYEGNADTAFSDEIDWAAMIAPVSDAAPDLEEVKKRRGDNDGVFFGKNVLKLCKMADIVYMGLHGDCGENGKIQGTFDLLGIKYTGTDAFSSALAMDKAISKQLFKMYGVATPNAHLLTGPLDDYIPQYPCVVKICNGGSSVGVYIVNDKEEYKAALKDAFTYESRVLVEEYVRGREFTCGVIEGEALPVVEIEPKEGFYDYKNKYQAGSTIETCPAQLSEELTRKLQDMAVEAYRALSIKTYARMDFLMNDKNEIFCLEANTLPGMTPTSLIPQEAMAIGKSYEDLCEWIIEASLRKY